MSTYYNGLGVMIIGGQDMLQSKGFRSADELRICLEHVENVLNEEEFVLWSGKPGPGIIFEKTDVFKIPIAVFFTVFATVWLYSNMKTGGWLGLPVFSLMGYFFVILGFYFALGRFFCDSFLRKKTIYILTNKRAFVFTRLFFWRIFSCKLDDSENVYRNANKNGKGSIRFGMDKQHVLKNTVWSYDAVTGYIQPNPGNYANVERVLAFYNIDEVEKVYLLIMDAINKH